MNPQGDRLSRGTVYLVGAGPGDPGLITRRGAEILGQADVIVHDRLVSPELLALARADAEMIFAGKEQSRHSLDQARINELLAERALRGEMVCRLKGGDPFVFGRGGEEAAYLRERGIPYAIVPGVSSAIAVPACAGIPLTDRRLASSFAVITGHRETSGARLPIDWARIAHGADTLVFLMGLGNLSTITEKLIAHGRPPTTPAAVIQEGTTARQRVVCATLGGIAEQARLAGLQPPVVIVVGDVVGLSRDLDGSNLKSQNNEAS